MKNLFTFLLIIIPFGGYTQTITTIAGTGTLKPDGIPAALADIGHPGLSTFDSRGNFYFVVNIMPPGAIKILMIDTTGIIHHIAGADSAGFSGDGGPATAARLSNAIFSFDTKGNIYINDFYNYRIRRIDASTHIINTIAGTGIIGHSPDGTMATAAMINSAFLCVDTSDNIYFSDRATWIRKIDKAGTITTIGGTGVSGITGNGGPATAADINVGYLQMDNFGNLFINGGNNIRKLNIASGIINDYAGTGVTGYIGDGMPATAAMFAVNALHVDSEHGNMFMTDDQHHRVYKIDAAGIFHLVAGVGSVGFSGDNGPATNAHLHHPEGVSIDACGNLYVSDFMNSRLRKINNGLSVSLSGSTSYPIGSAVTVAATVSSTCSSYIIHWMNNGIEFTTTTTPSVTFIKSLDVDSITARVVPLCGACYDSTTSTAHIISAHSLGIGQLVTKGGFTIYPNPVGDEVTISSTNKICKIVLTNLIGQVIYDQDYFSEKVSIALVNLPPGIYSTKITDEDGNNTITRIVKE